MRTYFYHSSYTFVFFLFVVFGFGFLSGNAFLSSTQSFTFSNNRSIVSPNRKFELGLFNPSLNPHNENRWYLGVSFKKISFRPYVWVANRDSPLWSPLGTIRVLKSKLILFDQSNEQKWSAKINDENEGSLIVANLQDDGNFILRHSNHNKVLWQSFDFPTDTLLPKMGLGWEVKNYTSKFLTSWQDANDPARGNYSFGIEDPRQTRGIPSIFIWSFDRKRSRINPLLDNTFTVLVPYDNPTVPLQFRLTVSKKGDVVFSYTLTDNYLYKSVVRLSASGHLEYIFWDETISMWSLWWYYPNNICDLYNFCGRNSYCNVQEVCNCLSGYVPKNPEAWTLNNTGDGCVRKDKSICLISNNYQLLENVTLPETTNAVVKSKIGINECNQTCVTDCNCTAFTTVLQNGSSSCVKWTGELLDVQQYNIKSYDLYVKREKDKKPNTKLIIGLGVFALGCIITAFIVFYRRRCKRLDNDIAVTSQIGHLSREDRNFVLRLMSFQTIADATENFSDSNKLGKGGFGIVYKGRLHDNQEIAVKRLSVSSSQGLQEFKNELMLITKLQHVNLVRLIGYCINGVEKLLIYEYLENRSLDLYLFDAFHSSKLQWQSRLHIIVGIARGLLYLHEYSVVRIIHRDLKPSNVLLDKHMNPKISDFGMARIFRIGSSEADTSVIAGTSGYIAPEYGTNGIYSVKSDVFSFGVMILEILSGKMNSRFHRENKDETTLLTYAWKKWTEGEWECVIDHAIDSPSTEVKRCFQIGLLCVQLRPEDRPIMSSVFMMLVTKTEIIPLPNPPCYFFDQAEASSSNTQTESTANTQTDSTANTQTDSTSRYDNSIDPR